MQSSLSYALLPTTLWDLSSKPEKNLTTQNLPLEIIHHILSYCNYSALSVCAQLNQNWHISISLYLPSISRIHSIWRQIMQTNLITFETGWGNLLPLDIDQDWIVFNIGQEQLKKWGQIDFHNCPDKSLCMIHLPTKKIVTFPILDQAYILKIQNKYCFSVSYNGKIRKISLDPNIYIPDKGKETEKHWNFISHDLQNLEDSFLGLSPYLFFLGESTKKPFFSYDEKTNFFAFLTGN
jgi:hypothetical protein